MLRIIITKAICLDYYNLVLLIKSRGDWETVTGSSKTPCSTRTVTHSSFCPFILWKQNKKTRQKQKGWISLSVKLRGFGVWFFWEGGSSKLRYNAYWYSLNGLIDNPSFSTTTKKDRQKHKAPLPHCSSKTPSPGMIHVEEGEWSWGRALDLFSKLCVLLEVIFQIQLEKGGVCSEAWIVIHMTVLCLFYSFQKWVL